MRVQATIEIGAPAALVWREIADPARVRGFMAGVTRWDVAGDRATGLGARYKMLMRIGSAEVGGLIEVVEFAPDRDLAWTSVTGVDQRGRWRLRARRREGGAEATHVELRLAYGIAGAGLSGWLAEQIAAPAVRAHLRRSLWQLRRRVEHDQLRARAAERRAARAAAG